VSELRSCNKSSDLGSEINGLQGIDRDPLWSSIPSRPWQRARRQVMVEHGDEVRSAGTFCKVHGRKL
jgi:hypothetical protein